MNTLPLVLITGASSGIGQALALRYHRAGWRLALVARRSDEMRQWAAAQRIASDRVTVYGADVCDLAAIGEAGRDCIANQGLPEVVIANAGISVGMDSAVSADLAVMRSILETNVLGVAATFQPFLAAMRSRGSGTLVGIASVAGIRGLPGHGAYCASKAAVIAYCESLRGECRPDGIKVVTLAPGYIDTPQTQRNRYAMPFLLSAERFADKAYRSIKAGQRFRVIPWQMGAVVTLMRLMPSAWHDRLFAGRPRKSRQGE